MTDNVEIQPPPHSTAENTIEHLVPTMWKPGQSGNPAGRPKVPNEIKRLAKENAPAAFAKIVELVNSDDERVALMAAKEVIERAWGKVKEADTEDSKVSLSDAFEAFVRVLHGAKQITQ